MARIGTVVQQLKTYLPRVTTRFTDTFTINAITGTNNIVTALTSQLVNYRDGDEVLITGVQIPVAIDIITLDSTNLQITVTTLEAHDLTMGFQVDAMILGDPVSEYDGTFAIISVPDRNTCVLQLTTLPTQPFQGGWLYDGSSRGIDGFKTITIVDETTFTFPSTQITVNPGASAENSLMQVHGNFRITGSSTLGRTIEAYTPQLDNDDYWLFVVKGDTIANKKREIENDSTDLYNAGAQEYKQQLFQQFLMYVYARTVDSPIPDLAATDVADEMELVRRNIFSAILGFFPPGELNEQSQYGMTFVEDKINAYNASYYVHEFIFELIFYITGCDLDRLPENVAMRDILLNVRTYLPDGTISDPLSTRIDLDDQPTNPL